ncbi:transposase [Gilliamella sp. ESL0250]|nr:transposase [Gilliamella sp. ESL0250]
MIRTLMRMRHNQQIFEDSKDRQQKLKRFINYYNTVKPHKAISGKTPYAFLAD